MRQEDIDEKEATRQITERTLKGTLVWRRVWNPFSFDSYRCSVGSFKLRIRRWSDGVRCSVTISQKGAVNCLSFTSTEIWMFLKQKRAKPTYSQFLAEFNKTADWLPPTSK